MDHCAYRRMYIRCHLDPVFVVSKYEIVTYLLWNIGRVSGWELNKSGLRGSCSFNSECSTCPALEKIS